MRGKSLLHRLTLGLLIGVMMMPAEPAHAQWTVFDPSQYALQIKKRLEEAQRYVDGERAQGALFAESGSQVAPVAEEVIATA